MASELRVNTLKDASGNNSVATSVVFNGSAKAWINFNGTGTVATRDSYNISSLTDNGTGLYTLSWSSNFANDDYANAGMSGQQSAAMINVSCTIDTTAPTTSASQYNTMYENSGSGNFDCTQVTIQVLGDLA